MKALFALLALLPILGGCNSTWYSHRFTPAPLEVPIGLDDQPSAQASVLLTVRGIRRAVPETGEPAEVEVLLRIENLGSTPALLDAQSLSLVTADLVPFDSARLDPAVPPLVAQGDQIVHTIRFPLPPGTVFSDLDWRSMHLRWTIIFDERRVTTGVTFERLMPQWSHSPYSPLYPYPRYRHF